MGTERRTKLCHARSRYKQGHCLGFPDAAASEAHLSDFNTILRPAYGTHLPRFMLLAARLAANDGNMTTEKGS